MICVYFYVDIYHLYPVLKKNDFKIIEMITETISIKLTEICQILFMLLLS